MTQLYTNNDMARVGCHDCQGCHSCCEGMGDSVWVDPYDMYLLTKNLNKSFQELMEGPIELHVEDGLILPNLRMVEAKNHQCFFLDKEGRCQIHSFRPGFCRLFPLGRNYEEDKLTYFVLEEACPVKNKTKMKIQKWIQASSVQSYEHYLVNWHRLTKNLRVFCQNPDIPEERKKKINMQFLQYFFGVPYETTTEDPREVYELIEKRVEEFENLLK